MDELKKLAADIATTGKWRARPGQAMRPEFDAGVQFRLSSTGSWWQESGVVNTLAASASWLLGPDLADDTTVLSLLADLPNHSLLRATDPDGWYCTDGAVTTLCKSRAEAVACAWMLAHKVAA